MNTRLALAALLLAACAPGEDEADLVALDSELSVRKPARTCANTSFFTKFGVLRDLAESVGPATENDEWSVRVRGSLSGFVSYGLDGFEVPSIADLETDHLFDYSPPQAGPASTRVRLSFGGWRAPGSTAEIGDGFDAARRLYDAMAGRPERSEYGVTTRASVRGYVECRRWTAQDAGSSGSSYECSISNVVRSSTRIGACRAAPF